MTPDLPVNYRIEQWIDAVRGLSPERQKALIWGAYQDRMIDRSDREELLDQLTLRDA